MHQTPTLPDLDLLLETMISTDGVRPCEEALQLLCEKTSEVLGSAATMLRLVDEDGGALRTVALANTVGALTPEHVDVARNEVLPLGDLSTHIVRRGALPPSVEAFLSGEVQVIPFNTSPEFPLASMCVAPLIRRGQSRGVLALYWTEPHDPDDDQRRLIRIAARIAAIVVEVTTAAGRVASERDHAHRSAAEERCARERAESLLAFAEHAADVAVQDPDPEALLATLADRGVPARMLSEVSGAAAGVRKATPSAGQTRRIPIQGAEQLHGALEHLPGSEEDARKMRFAARLIAIELDQKVRERRLTSARERALLLVTHPSAAASAVAAAEALLGIDDACALVLLVAEFADAESARAQADSPTAALILPDATVVASGPWLLALLSARSHAARLAPWLTAADGFLGVGHTGPIRPGVFGRMLQDATTAAHISRARGGRLVAYDEVGTVLSVTAGMPEQEARTLIAETLGPIEAYDSKHDARLLDTLVTYLSENGSTTATAKRLHLHVNTVKQRVERINELTGADVRDYTFVARLLLALEWRSLLGG